MIFESTDKVYNEKTARYIAEWHLDTDTQTVTYTDRNTLETKEWHFHEDFVRYHLHYREENAPELLQKTVDEGAILQYLEDLVIKVKDKIEEQKEIWCNEDKEFLVANENGNLTEICRIANTYKEQAKDSVYAVYVYA